MKNKKKKQKPQKPISVKVDKVPHQMRKTSGAKKGYAGPLNKTVTKKYKDGTVIISKSYGYKRGGRAK
tara:strand:- start:393 stop:596 length:204 start_codon:yes stop_codon:yes gene_type:complete